MGLDVDVAKGSMHIAHSLGSSFLRIGLLSISGLFLGCGPRKSDSRKLEGTWYVGSGEGVGTRASLGSWSTGEGSSDS